MRCLVTGGAGFVGANLVRRLLDDGHEVHVVLRGGSNTWRLEDVLNKVRPHRLDLCDDQIGEVVTTIRPQWVFHLAAYGAYSWQRDLRRMVQTNLQGTINLVQASLLAGVERLVNAGSSSEYGYKDHPAKESECAEPNSHYAVTKAAATLFCQHTARREHLPISTLRLYSAFGAFEDPDRLMPKLIVEGRKGGFPPLVNPDIARDYVHVDDVVDAFLLAASNGNHQCGGIYNVCTGVQSSLEDVVNVARHVLSVKTEPIWGSMPGRQWDTNSWVGDNGLIRESLGWKPRYSLRDGFQQMANWYMEMCANGNACWEKAPPARL
jgi:nucleoside-diphosphate-sugar epimerase